MGILFFTKPKWQIVFGLSLVMAGVYTAISAAMNPYHLLFSQMIDGVVGITVAFCGLFFTLLGYYKFRKNANE